MYSSLICTISAHGNGEKIAEYLREKGAGGGTILVGRGKKNSAFLRFLAIDETECDILITLVTDEEKNSIFDALSSYTFPHKHDTGIVFSLRTGGKTVTQHTDYELISVIVNRGYADDIMDAARAAGAYGGTILHARGTGKPDDEKFFGITIVPEKEQVLIVCERETADRIRESIEKLPCLDTPGIGILYTMPVEHFIQLGKKK